MSKARQLADLGNVYDDGALSNRNLIINGAMQVAQRGTSETGKTSAGYYSVDRFKLDVGSAGTWTISQSTTAPDGFGYSYKLDCTTAEASLSTGDYCLVQQHLEGQDLQRLQFGTSSAKNVTLSFWVRSNKTGTYPVYFFNTDNQRSNGFTYTIDTADTWEYKTHIFDGDTAQGFDNDEYSSVQLEWWVAAGTSYTSGATPTGWQAHDNTDRAAGLDVNLADSTSNEWYLTGVQLEVGDTATPFEHRSYGDELARCQRYYYKTYNDSTAPSTATNVGIVSSTLSQSFQNTGYIELYNVPYAVKMRASPTITVYDTSGNSGKCNYYQSATLVVNNTITSHAISENGFAVYSDNVTSKGGIGFHFTADAEL